MLGWMKHKLELGLPGEILITSDMEMTRPLWHKAKKKTKDETNLMNVKEESEKKWLKTQHSEY